MFKWMAFLLLGMAVVSPAAAQKTVTISITVVTDICAGDCSGREVVVRDTGDVRTRRFEMETGRLEQERHVRFDPAKYAAFEQVLATIRPAGESVGKPCDRAHMGFQWEIRWQGDRAPSHLSGCLTRDVRSANHVWCTAARALNAMGFGWLGYPMPDDPATSGDLNGCGAEGFEALSPADGGPFSPARKAARTLTYARYCSEGCRQYWFQIDSLGNGLFRERDNSLSAHSAAFTVTPAEFAMFEAALAPYRPQVSDYEQANTVQCSPRPEVGTTLEIAWSDGYDTRENRLGLRTQCDGTPLSGLGAAFDAPMLLPALRPLIAALPMEPVK
jgi:hypothetical protein